MNQPLRVAFIGLGAMGEHMARHLHRAGLLTALSNRTLAKAQALAQELGATNSGEPIAVAADPRELPAHCNVVISCVTADADVLQIATSLAQANPAGLVMIDMSTVASTTAQQAANLLRSVGADFIDAPVSGGVEGAKNGKLSVMAGGEAATLERVRPALECLAARITLMGPVGAGQNTKAVNQVLIAGIAQAVTEGLALGEALGLDSERLLATLGAGAAANWFMDKRGPTMLRDEFSVGFKLALLHKDLKIVQQLARDAGTDRTVIDKSIVDYAQLMAQGHGDDDISGLIRLKRPHRS